MGMHRHLRLCAHSWILDFSLQQTSNLVWSASHIDNYVWKHVSEVWPEKLSRPLGSGLGSILDSLCSARLASSLGFDDCNSFFCSNTAPFLEGRLLCHFKKTTENGGSTFKGCCVTKDKVTKEADSSPTDLQSAMCCSPIAPVAMVSFDHHVFP